MRIADIKYPDVANGKGVRVSIFVQGCNRHCKGCFNEETWDFKGGRSFTDRDREKIFEYLSYSWVSGLSVLGGEPLEQDITLADFLAEVKSKFPGKDIWMWTGYKYEEVKDRTILKYVDVLVDGAFEEDKKDLDLLFRGSSNQRIINLFNERRKIFEKDNGCN